MHRFSRTKADDGRIANTLGSRFWRVKRKLRSCREEKVEVEHRSVTSRDPVGSATLLVGELAQEQA
jgi:hypothetical protein